MTADIQYIRQFISESGRKVWRFSDLQHWRHFYEHHLLTLSLLNADMNYRTADLSLLKRGKRIISLWVHQLQCKDLIFLLDKTHYYGIAVADMEYHPFNPLLSVGKKQAKPAIRIQWVHLLEKGEAHNFDFGTTLDAFASLEQKGLGLEKTLLFLQEKHPVAVQNLLEYLGNEQQKSIETYSTTIEKQAEEIANFPNPNVILYGPAGTGKTYGSMDLAVEILGKTTGERETNHHIFKQYLGKQIEMVTFHPNYAYEDFIQGLRPVSAGKNKNLQFVWQDGIFKRLANRATLNYLENKRQLNIFDVEIKQLLEQKNSSYQQSIFSANMLNENAVAYQTKNKANRNETVGLKNYVLIVDEINRANLASVLGELMSLLEKDKRYDAENALAVNLPSGERFVVPPNLYVIGTMNTTDTTIAMLDMALRRRFDFVACYPKYDLPNLAHAEKLKAMNEKIVAYKGRDFQIGHAYFLKDKHGNFDLQYVLERKIIPLLMAYFPYDVQLVEAVLKAGDISCTIDEQTGELKLRTEDS
ncbi:MAG: McrB family protein [Chitinophagales bacterium]